MSEETTEPGDERVELTPRASEGARTTPWRQAALLLATIASMFYVGGEGALDLRGLLRGWTFAVPMIAILLTHELGHYVQARRYGVDASLPYFLPMPWSPIGTFGAVIVMRGRIRTRDALFDIGASGPLAGLAVAIPVLLYGLAHSKVEPIPLHGVDEGQSLLYLAAKRVVLGPIPAGYDVFLHPTALAGWAGLFMTMLNLLPIGQLDGGHVAYALLGPRQDRISRWLHRALLGLFVVIAALRAHARWAMTPGWLAAREGALDAMLWLVWFGILTYLTWGERAAHPPTDDDRLSTGRKLLAVLTLALFPLLFMPTVLTAH